VARSESAPESPDAPAQRVECGGELRLLTVPGLPRIGAGDDVGRLLVDALRAADLSPRDCDILVVTSKLASRAEDRFVDLATVSPDGRAVELAERTDKDPRLVELILRESTAVSRTAPGVLIVRHRLGFVSANAGIDASNARPARASADSGPWVLLLPVDPDGAATRIRRCLQDAFGVRVGVLLSDSHGRPFRLGSMGTAIGSSGLPVLADRCGAPDLDGRTLEHTVAAVADPLAAAADLVAGQGAEGRPVTLVRGLRFTPSDEGAAAALRPSDGDLYL